MIKAVIFDLDDTLYDEETYVFQAFSSVANYLGEKYNLNNNDVYNDILGIFYKDGRGKIFNDICDKYNLKEEIQTLVDIYRNTKPRLSLYKDAKDIIIYLKEKDHKLGLITDGYYLVQNNKINSLNLRETFHHIIVTDEVSKEYWKPSEEPYKDMAKVLKVNYDEMVYIGDNPTKDFIAPRNLGMQGIRIVREKGDYMKLKSVKEKDEHIRITSLSNLKEIIIGM